MSISPRVSRPLSICMRCCFSIVLCVFTQMLSAGCATVVERSGTLSSPGPYHSDAILTIPYYVHGYSPEIESVLAGCGAFGPRRYLSDDSATMSIFINSDRHDSTTSFIESLPAILNGLSFGVFPMQSYVSIRSDITVLYRGNTYKYNYWGKVVRRTSVLFSAERDSIPYTQSTAIWHATEAVENEIKSDMGNKLLHDMQRDGLLPKSK